MGVFRTKSVEASIKHTEDSEHRLHKRLGPVDLTVFGIVVSMLEGGHLYRPSSQKNAQRIIDICHREQHRLLSEYDEAVARQP